MPPSANEIEQSSWNRVFSGSSIRSYAAAAVHLYDALVDLEDRGYEAAVFPSRGTTPFKDLTWLVHSSGLVSQRGPTAFHHSINTPFAYGTIDLPFTADPPEHLLGGSVEIRDYWVRVLKALLTHEDASQELRYYQYCLSKLFGFEPELGLPLRRAGSRFVFVDTVVSGRAVCEIAASFEAHGLTEFCFVLLVDDEGRKLTPKYRLVLEDLATRGKAKLIYVESLFTEDKGPALTSTWCLSAPQLIESACEAMGGTDTRRLVGTAVSFVRIQADSTLRNVSSTIMRATLNSLLSQAMREYLATEPRLRQFYTRLIEQTRLELVELAMQKERSGHNPLSTDETRRIACQAIKAGISVGFDRKPIGLSVIDVEVSSSHVVRLLFNGRDVQRFLWGFRKSEGQAALSKHRL